MPFDPVYHEVAPSREELDQMQGPVLVEFGANWCGYCKGFAPDLEELMRQFPEVTHIKVEDGRGKRLGRSFSVKLWPSLIFMRDGNVVRQFARPTREEALQGLRVIAGHGE